MDSRNYTKQGKVACRLFDVVFIDNFEELLAWPADQIARWRDGGGQQSSQALAQDARSKKNTLVGGPISGFLEENAKSRNPFRIALFVSYPAWIRTRTKRTKTRSGDWPKSLKNTVISDNLPHFGVSASDCARFHKH